MTAQSELGDFLRARRARLQPKAVGLAGGRRRRTPGLRREEVAELAGIGVDWYTRLEQGRGVSPSATTLEALARALRLSKAELAHLKALARKPERAPFVREQVPKTLQAIVDGLALPAYITGQRWDVLAWNHAAEEIFAFGRLAERDRNTLIAMFTGAKTRRLFGTAWAEEARRMLAQFRAHYDLWAGDPAFAELVARLSAESAEFGKWWRAHDIRAASGGEKRLEHPKKGALRLAYASFQANDDPALKLTIYTPA